MRLVSVCVALVLVAPPVALAAGAGTITVGPAASGKTIRIRVADTLVVRLAGNPTTGYRWTVKREPRILRLVGSTNIPAPPKRLGQGGTVVFRFRALFAGYGTLRLEYRRPWETGKPPLRTFTLNITAR